MYSFGSRLDVQLYEVSELSESTKSCNSADVDVFIYWWRLFRLWEHASRAIFSSTDLPRIENHPLQQTDACSDKLAHSYTHDQIYPLQKLKYVCAAKTHSKTNAFGPGSRASTIINGCFYSAFYQGNAYRMRGWHLWNHLSSSLWKLRGPPRLILNLRELMDSDVSVMLVFHRAKLKY